MPNIETDYPQGAVIVENLYPAKLKEVSEYMATFDGKETPKLAWVFEVEAPESALDEDVEIEEEDYEYPGYVDVAFHTSLSAGPKSKMRPMLEAMMGAVPRKLNTDDMIGLPAQVYVVQFEKNGSPKNVIDRVSKPKKNQKPAAKQPPAKEVLDEKGFEKIPF